MRSVRVLCGSTLYRNQEETARGENGLNELITGGGGGGVQWGTDFRSGVGKREREREGRWRKNDVRRRRRR